MSNNQLGKVKKKPENKMTFSSSEVEKLMIGSLKSAKPIYTPIPLKSNGQSLKSQIISQPGGFNIQPNILTALLNFKTAENFQTLNSLTNLLRLNQELTCNGAGSGVASQLLDSAKNSSANESKISKSFLLPGDQIGSIGKNSSSKMEKRKSIRKQTSFAITDVKSESSSADEKGKIEYSTYILHFIL